MHGSLSGYLDHCQGFVEHGIEDVYRRRAFHLEVVGNNVCI
jgi:hypothetical protein